MSKISDTLEKAYANVPKEPGLAVAIDLEIFRPMRYYWLRLFRKIIGR